MSSDKSESLSEKWSERFDDRDDEDLACQIWARRLSLRDEAMANPVKGVAMNSDAKPSSNTSSRPEAK